MRHVKLVSLCLVVVFALGAIMAAGASAETLEWGYCRETSHGKYLNAGCTEKAEKKAGAYEWTPFERGWYEELPVGFEGPVVFETAAGVKIQCNEPYGLENAGDPNAKNDKTPVWDPSFDFQGCESGGTPCGLFNPSTKEINNKFAWREEAPTNGKGEPEGPAPGWVGKLGFISGEGSESPVVGVQYTVKNKEEEPYGEPVVCEGGPGTVRIRAQKGKTSWISTIGPVNTMTSEFTQVYSESAPGVPSVSNLEGKKPERFEMFTRQHWEPAATVATLHLYYPPGPVEIKATK
jgi:hypothetical protein